MKRPKRDPVREDRIYNEAIVDARPEEQAMSWYYYLEGKITFPFRARCVAANAVSPLRKGETVEVLRMAIEDACEHDMFVQIRWRGRKMAVPLSNVRSSIRTNQQRKPSATGITGYPRVIASDLRTAPESSQSYAIDVSCAATTVEAETDPAAEHQPRVLQVETRFLRLRQPATLGDHIDGWRLCWLGGWDRGRLFLWR